MMAFSRISLIILSLIGSTMTFSPSATMKHQHTLSKSALQYTIVEPPDDDNCEIDNSNCEESVFAQKRKEKAEEKERLRNQMLKSGLKLTEIDRMETVDQVGFITNSVIRKSHSVLNCDCMTLKL